ncbi:protein-(glutamine-N5) methyltransferase, release factor-specific [Erwinia sp. OLTSP20]|uniref:peptide chain release factor N(5)-glutamine methyltransferase n=1 Tax=unclassified Erwinia TaxID=2622719 RepID=UPI000C176C5C|nr:MULTISPECIES: peptide chain release factor N(5)-glutamine methyltransferase [unclassified Erwinia]PIJ49965.1 protein-(glutamine-N5) methyltransferase, release factor-specific [Erwinia sp. OAMSP11]PIJ71387.1 protein-(glutamine-N5) methyltransferase, release factor-specific [Erwinia sp. OLSSP12]PIJ80622.1 protein-(glutamine-N5) methyltransferase, release factor-specific [Erwinia sp. OLCASP19]PIJ82782.1 protein-(glutamine-N5) methyltransferase, release factor-specific [Erwinia sp. OLMTSP26]PIJ
MQIRDWLPAAMTQLKHSDSPRADAEILLAFVTGKNRSWLRAFDETVLTGGQLSRLEHLMARREKGEPVAYLTGEREFWSLTLQVSPHTLIPRPDSEVLVECALEKMVTAQGQALDLGSGSGAIALALACERPGWQITGVDRITEAVQLAQLNRENLAIANARFLCSDWYSALQDQHFDLIVSNPPYIDAADSHLRRGDVRFEPLSALVAGEQGLADIRHIVLHAAGHLHQQGWLLLEHGWQQADHVRQILRDAGFVNVETRRDYGGNDRVTSGQRAAGITA